MRNASARGNATSPPISVRRMATSTALIAETATLVATAEPPKITTASNAAANTVQFMLSWSLRASPVSEKSIRGER